MADQKEHPMKPRPWWKAGLILVLLAGGLVAGYQVVAYRHFYIPSGSMEPTLRGSSSANGGGGDHVRADVLLSRLGGPRRGQIWIFRAPPQAAESEPLFIFRVIGVPGDTVEVVAPRLLLDGRTLAKVPRMPESEGPSLEANEVPKVDPSGASATLDASFNASPIRVVAHPEPKLEQTPRRVKVNGKVELEDEAGRIQAKPALAAYGAEAGVEGVVYLVEGEPRLIVAKGKKLAYDPGHVLLNGNRPQEPYISEPPDYGYGPTKLDASEYFVLGDNRNNAHDSHSWGSLTRDRFVGHVRYRFWPPHRIGAL
jgi:signal peptidase I